MEETTEEKPKKRSIIATRVIRFFKFLTFLSLIYVGTILYVIGQRGYGIVVYATLALYLILNKLDNV